MLGRMTVPSKGRESSRKNWFGGTMMSWLGLSLRCLASHSWRNVHWQGRSAARDRGEVSDPNLRGDGIKMMREP